MIFVNIIFGFLMLVLVALFVKDWEMIKVEAVFDGEKIIVNGKMFKVVAEHDHDTMMVFEGSDQGLYFTIEEAVEKCMESKNEPT